MFFIPAILFPGVKYPSLKLPKLPGTTAAYAPESRARSSRFLARNIRLVLMMTEKIYLKQKIIKFPGKMSGRIGKGKENSTLES